ncbi:18762_t:CDS:1, partial [Rhizophagus irregularis]
DNDPGKRPTASYLNENLEEWIILICDDPNPSKISDKNSIAEEKRWRKFLNCLKNFHPE